MFRMIKEWRESRRLRQKERRLAWYEGKKQIFLTTENVGVLSRMLFHLPEVCQVSTYPYGAMSVGMEVTLSDGWRTSINEYAMGERDCTLVCASRILSELARRENVLFDWKYSESEGR